jgi:hypothetical protein
MKLDHKIIAIFSVLFFISVTVFIVAVMRIDYRCLSVNYFWLVVKDTTFSEKSWLP